MPSEEQITALRQHVANAIADELMRANIDWASFDRLAEPSVCIEAEFQDRSGNIPSPGQRPSPGLKISQVIDLSRIISPRSSITVEENNVRGAEARQNAKPTQATALPSSHSKNYVASRDAVNRASSKTRVPDITNENRDASDEETHDNGSRMAISGLRPSRWDIPVVEDNTQRQMQVKHENFPKRRKAEAVGYAMKPSTLDKLITGIWEQLHSGLSIDPVEMLSQFTSPPLLGDGMSPLQGGSESSLSSPATGLTSASTSTSTPTSTSTTASISASPLSSPLSTSPSTSSGRQFSDTTLFCRKVTQASRTCRAVEVIVQARWVEHFDAYVAQLKAQDSNTSGTRHRKAALVEAAARFGWAEKELRNKMAIWQGYREIKDAGGWAALVFAGMGIYRFCKYRIGFDGDSLQRLRCLNPALQVAADTLNPGWRRLLAIVGEPSAAAERVVYAGHPHDWVVCLDGAPPVPLRKTYLQWDPQFEFKHIEESVIDQASWGCDDPRWTPPSSTKALARVSNLPICQTCSNEQADDPKLNCCYCFPSLFGCATLAPAPVQVFRTPDGRNNGLMALCAFERGAAVGEFVGVVTKGLQDVDVMENTTGSTRYQIWQGRQGNFTRFINHSCNANAQYQEFTWLDTQRIVLVSKGIDAGSEITVDYSDKYWKGLDKKCLCGEKSCRYRRDR